MRHWYRSATILLHGWCLNLFRLTCLNLSFHYWYSHIAVNPFMQLHTVQLILMDWCSMWGRPCLPFPWSPDDIIVLATTITCPLCLLWYMICTALCFPTGYVVLYFVLTGFVGRYHRQSASCAYLTSCFSFTATVAIFPPWALTNDKTLMFF